VPQTSPTHRPEVTRAAYLADAPARPLRLEADSATGMVRGVWPLTWEGVRDYPGEAYGRPGGTVRVAHLPDQVRSPGFLRLVRNVASTLDHPSRVGRDGRAVDQWLHADAGEGAGRLPDPPPGGEWVDPRQVLVGWGSEPELRDVPGEHGPVTLPVTEVTVFDTRAKDLIAWGARDSSLGYSPLMVWEPGTYTAPDGTTQEYDAWHLLDPDHPLVADSGNSPSVNHFAVGIWAGRGGLQSKALDALPGAWGAGVPARFAINGPVAPEGAEGEGAAPGPKAAGVAFPDGSVALWCRESGACTIYRSVAALMEDHGEGGAALLEWLDPPPPASLLGSAAPEGGEGEGGEGPEAETGETGETEGPVLVINVTAGDGARRRAGVRAAGVRDEDGDISLPIAMAPVCPPWQDFATWADPASVTPVDEAPEAIRSAVRATMVPYAQAVAGWVGYSEADGAIAFWADNGRVLAWAERGPDGGVVGEPVAVDPRPRAAADSKGKARPAAYAGGVKFRSTSPAAVAAARIMASGAVTSGPARDASLTLEIPDEYAPAVEPVLRALEEAYAAKAAEAAAAVQAQGAAETQAAQAQAAAEAAQGAQGTAEAAASGLQAANTEQAAQLEALRTQLDELTKASAVDRAHATRWRAHEASVLVADASARGLALDSAVDGADPHAVRSAILRQLAPASAERVIAAGPDAVEATVTTILASAKPRTAGLRDAAPSTPAPAPTPKPTPAPVAEASIFDGFNVG